eukprot:582384-Hanusia_phi.AAC.2
MLDSNSATSLGSTTDLCASCNAAFNFRSFEVETWGVGVRGSKSPHRLFELPGEGYLSRERCTLVSPSHTSSFQRSKQSDSRCSSPAGPCLQG